jgi:hypothetical protein
MAVVINNRFIVRFPLCFAKLFVLAFNILDHQLQFFNPAAQVADEIRDHHPFEYRGPRDPSARSGKPSAQAGNSDMIAHMESTLPNPTGGSQTTSSWIRVNGR